MKHNVIRSAILLITALLSPVVIAQNAISVEQQKQIEKIVHDYLVKNPEVIIEAIQSLQQKQIEQAKKTIKETEANLPKFSEQLFHQTNDPIVGDPNAKITIVDFFDYQCPHCSKMEPVLEAIVKKNPQVRIVFKEFPIRGPVSELASKVALASQKQNKYYEFHKALMQQSTTDPLTEEAVYKTAKSVGLDIAKLKADIKDNAINLKIKENIKLAQQLKLMGTPSFMIAKTTITKNPPVGTIVFVPGLVEQAQLEEHIAKMNH